MQFAQNGLKYHKLVMSLISVRRLLRDWSLILPEEWVDDINEGNTKILLAQMEGIQSKERFKRSGVSSEPGVGIIIFTES